MKKLAKLLSATALITVSTFSLPSAHAWTPWGGSLFGIDFGQSTGYPKYSGSGNGPWGLSMFGLDFGQSAGYGNYYGGPRPYAYPPYYPQLSAIAASTTATKEAKQPTAAY